MNEIPLDSERWSWGPDGPEHVEFRGRRCVRLESTTSSFLATPGDVQLVDGVLEADLAVRAERSVHGLVWRVEDDESFES